MKLLLCFLFAGWAAVRAVAQTQPPPSVGDVTQTVETIVCVRHGEKPKGGLGQLNCRGLNRALALPKVLLGKYGKPDFVFAPNPTQKSDTDRYYYVRPLVTIEPTAIRCGLPINTKFGFREISGLEQELQKPEYHKATVFVAWEHALLDVFAKDMVKARGGDPVQVPGWAGTDFDSIFLLKITRNGQRETITFSVDHEGLNNLSDDCPD
ncbi:MAG TPA: hypothetical protein VHZ30_08320 [Verrucomicrobiae bacterium]|nr:hypothetical protein [Verrucomicrobiae bacterium]